MTFVPMALGHLYLPPPAAWAAGMEVGRGTAPSEHCYLVRRSLATKLIAAVGHGIQSPSAEALGMLNCPGNVAHRDIGAEAPADESGACGAV
jgi:hypothetical protein